MNMTTLLLASGLILTVVYFLVGLAFAIAFTSQDNIEALSSDSTKPKVMIVLFVAAAWPVVIGCRLAEMKSQINQIANDQIDL